MAAGKKKKTGAGTGGKGRYFRRSLALLLIIASVPSLFIAVSNYWIGVHQTEREALNSHRLRTEQVSELLTRQFDQIAMVMSRWSTNSLFGEYLDRFSFLDNIGQSQQLMQTMLVIGGSNLYIKDARLFLGRQQSLLASDGIEKLTGSRLDTYNQLLERHEGLFLAYDLPVSDKGSAVPVSMIFKLPWYAEKPFGAFVINLSSPEIERSVKYLQTDNQGTAFLMQRSGEWITKPNGGTSELAEALRQKILGMDGGELLFPFEWEGKKYEVLASKVTQANWLYVTATPVSVLLKPVLSTSRLLATVGLIGLLAGLILSWVATERLYRPIGRLVRLLGDGNGKTSKATSNEIEYIEQQWARVDKESRTLRDRLRQAEPSLREGFLLQLVQGHLYAFGERDLRERMEQLGWQAHDRDFSLLLIQLSGLTDDHARFRESDRQLVSFAAANIAGEMATERKLEAYPINFQNLSVGLLVSIPRSDEPDEARRKLLAFSKDLIGMLGHMLNMHATIIVCRWADRIGSVPELLEEARRAVSYRDMQEVHQVIDLNRFDRETPAGPRLRYPSDQESELLHAMRLGLPKETEAAFNGFMDEAERISDRSDVFRQTCLQWMGQARGMLIELGFGQHPLFTEGGLYEELLALPDAGSVRIWLWRRIVGPYLEEFGKAQDIGARRLVEQAAKWIEERFTEDLPLETCAEQLQTSPFTLSRSFKQVLGVGYVEHIQNLRMAKAKELLSTTTLRISEVAERVGYQHSYFNKLFKGETGMTPTQYREHYGQR